MLKEKKNASIGGVVLEAPAWATQVGMAAGGLGLLFFLGRLAAKAPGGLHLPYGFALLAAGAYLLWVSQGRIEIDEEKVTCYHGDRVVRRCATRKFEDVRTGFLAKKLVFSDGGVVSVPDFFTNSGSVTAFFHRRVETRVARELEGEAASQLRGRAAVRVPGRPATLARPGTAAARRNGAAGALRPSPAPVPVPASRVSTGPGTVPRVQRMA